MENKIKRAFERKVYDGLVSCEVRPDIGMRLGVAVSGGADSISLLYSLATIASWNAGTLEVITVNHYMRPDEETCGDVKFVVSECEKIKICNVTCTVVELKKGEVFETARERGAGSEEAARFLRYKAFEKFIEEKKLDYLCLAHNKNDQLETVLMRFLQGSNADSSGGIRRRRESYIRPLLDITREEIEAYLNSMNIGWCEDKSNEDTNYYRNNVRHNLIPFLNENFKGWDKAVCSGAEKSIEDAKIIKNITDDFEEKYFNIEKNKNGVIEKVFFDVFAFAKLSEGLKKRLLVKACNLVGETKRIPNIFLNEAIKEFEYKDESFVDKIKKMSSFSKYFGSIEIYLKKNSIFVKKHIKKDTDLVFFDIIEDDGIYEFPFGKLSVTSKDSLLLFSINGCEAIVNCNYPFCVRNAQPGDEIKSSSGNFKKVADIYSDWHIENYDKKVIPVISSFQNGTDELKCVLASFLGYKDWIVK